MNGIKYWKRIAVGVGGVALLAAFCCLPMAADAARTAKKPPVPAIDAEVYADFMASQPQDIKNLVDEAAVQRDFFNRITPPNVFLFQPMMPLVVPFDDLDFADIFLEGLLGEARNSVAVFPLSLSLDPKTRETLIFNADGELIAIIPAEKGSPIWPKGADPSRVTLLLDLLPAEDVEPYLYTESRIEESLTAVKARTPKSGGMSRKSLGSTEFGISGIQTLINGNMRITVSNGTDFAELFAYTVVHTSTVSGSNTFWLPTSPAFDGIQSAWECPTTNLVLTNGVAVWEDTTISSNARIRFYAAAKRMDTDSDGLTDGSEIFLNRTDTADIDTDGDDLLDGYDLVVDDQDVRHELWAAAGIVYVDDGNLRTFSGELSAETDPLDSDTDDDGISDGEDPEPTQPNQEPLVHFRHPFDMYQFEGPAHISLESDWLYSSESPSQVVYQIVSDLTGVTNEIQMATSGTQETNWYAPPGDFTLQVRGIDATGQTGEMHSISVTIDENPSFSALSPAEQQEVLTNGARAVEGMPEIFYRYVGSSSTGYMGGAETASISRIAEGFANATNFTVIPVSNSYLGVAYQDRDLMRVGVTYNTPTTNLEATLYGVTRWGARVEVDLPPPSAPLSGPIAGDAMLVFDQNEKGEWVGKVYPSLNTVDEYDPFALLHIGLGWERDAFLYQTGSFEALVAPTNYNGQDDIRLVFGLNNEGAMVGACFDYETGSGGSWIEDYQAVVYRSGQTGTLLSVSTQALGGAAYAVNDAGVIVGCEILSGEVPRAIQWVNGIPMELCGLTNATESVAYDISEDGAIAGMKKVNGQWEPFLTGSDGSNLLGTATFDGIAFSEFWHISKFGALGWSADSNSAQRLYWVIPDDDQDGFSDIIEQEIVDANRVLTNVVEVVTSGDYDGDGVTNLEEWELKTDPINRDSDGDRIPDGLDPLPMTSRDTDGDELPDDWETYYGLDPASASGADGASGDPDGDGLTNLEEFRLNGNPNDENSPGYRFHQERISQLRVDIPDSTNCGWVSNFWPLIDMHQTIQFVELIDTNLPPMEFIFNVSVTGRVALSGAGHIQATVNDKVALGSWRYIGSACEMTNISEEVLVTVHLPPGEVTLRCETFDNYYHVDAFAEVTDIQLVQVNTNVIKVDTIEAYYNKFGASGSFEANPEIFPGREWNFGQPDQPPPYWWLPGTYANPSSKVLKVFFKYIKDANDEPAPFDIDLKASILPDSISDEDLNITWHNWAGPPSSGSFDKTDEREVKFQNPTKGGLYKFRMEMEPQPYQYMASDAWVLLPKAGGEIADWMVSEVPSLVTRAQDWEIAVRAVAVSNGLNPNTFLETAWKAITTCDFDYQGTVGFPTRRYSFTDAEQPAGHVPDPNISGMRGEKDNGDWDEPSYATLRGIVVHRAKINNSLYAVWGRELGYSTALLRVGAFWNAVRRGLWDDATSQNAISLGGSLYDEYMSNGDLGSVLTVTGAKSIQSSSLNEENLWPDTNTVSSGFWLPTMPRDYDRLNEGENEIPRGRLFEEN